MVNVRYSNAMAELIHYLKGIKDEDINKIPKKFMNFIRENASKDYECKFDYNKPLNELNLLDETRGLIGMICYNYWCETKEQRDKYINRLNENEKNYQKYLREKYNPDNLFANGNHIISSKEQSKTTDMITYKKESLFSRIINKIKSLFII